MKIYELLEESDVDIEKALDAYTKKKELEKSRSFGSAFKRGLWKGKRIADKMVDNPLTHGIQKVNQWVKKQSK